MKRIFLTSHLPNVISDISKRLTFATKRKKVALIDTAEELEKDFVQRITADKEALTKEGFDVHTYSVSGKNEDTLRKDLADFDVLYVSGGNTFHLLRSSLESGFNNVAKKFVEMGKIYIGSSAGSIIAGPQLYPANIFDDSSEVPNPEKQKGFRLVDIIVFPHWGSPEFKEFYFNKKLEHAYTHTNKIVLLTNNQYVYILDDWFKIIDVNASDIIST